MKHAGGVLELKTMLVAALRHCRARAIGGSNAMLSPECGWLSRSLCVAVNREWKPESRRVGAIGMKCGMTHAWSATGQRVPLTVVELQDVQVTKVRRAMHDGTTALQLGSGWQKRKRLRYDDANQFLSRDLPMKRYLKEFQVTGACPCWRRLRGYPWRLFH